MAEICKGKTLISFAVGAPFWDYGYGDVYGGLFLALWLQRSRRLSAGRDVLAGEPEDAEPPGSVGEPARPAVRRLLQGDRRLADRPDPESVSPTPEQSSALDEFANATIRAAQTIKDACPNNVVFTPTGRLDAMQKRIEGMARAVDIVSPPLDRFYNMLTDEQKARLDAANEQDGRNRGSTASWVRSAMRRDGRATRSKRRSGRIRSSRPSSMRSKLAIDESLGRSGNCLLVHLAGHPSGPTEGDLQAAGCHAAGDQERPRGARRNRFQYRGDSRKCLPLTPEA